MGGTSLHLTTEFKMTKGNNKNLYYEIPDLKCIKTFITFLSFVSLEFCKNLICALAHFSIYCFLRIISTIATFHPGLFLTI